MEKENEVVYRNDKLPKNAFQCFEDTRRRQEFFDVTFIVGDYAVSAHRIVVLATMPRFREVFSSKVVLSKDIFCTEIDPSVLESLIDYAYTSIVKITTENVKHLLSGACRLGMKEVCRACCEFIAYDELCPQNLFSFLDLAQTLNCSELNEICKNYARENFPEISQTEEYLKLEFSFLRDVVGSDELVVVSEEKVYEAIIRWTKHLPEERTDHLPCLLKCVRMPFLGTRYLRKIVAKEELIRRSIECRDLLDEAKDYHYEPSERRDLHTFPAQLRSYHPQNRCEESEVYALSGEFSLTAHYMNTESTLWTLKKIEKFRMYSDTASVFTLHDKIYIFNWKNLWSYSPEENEIQSSNRFSHGRAVVVFNNKLYICGGSDGYSIFNTVKCFDPFIEEWCEKSCMRQCRTFASATVLGECIYVLGGESNEGVLNSVEKYNVPIQMWSSVPAMLTHRKKFSSAALNGKLYACGGITIGSNNCISTAEVYEPIIKQWKYISSMKIPRSLFSLMSYQGNLCAVGVEKNYLSNITSVEILNSDTHKWSDGPALCGVNFVSGASTVSKRTEKI